MPLYRRLPKLKGIAGGMSAGLPDFVTINVGDLASLDAGTVVSLETLGTARMVNYSGREATLPLKVLAGGSEKLTASLEVHAQAFSAGAKEAIEGAGGKVVLVPAKEKWLPARVKAKRAKEAAWAAAAGGAGE